MTNITITVDDPSGVDIATLFPGSVGLIAGAGDAIGTTAASFSYYQYIDGVLDTSVIYRLDFTGTHFAPSNIGGTDVTGNITSITLSRSIGATTTQLAHVSFSLDGFWNTYGGIAMASAASFTADYFLSHALMPIQGSSSRFVINGAAGNDRLPGSSGSDVIDGKGGADSMIGFGGSDFYYVNAGADRVIEGPGGGRDWVIASVGFALGAGQAVEILSTDNQLGTAAINLTGNEFANEISGNAAGNILNGGGGADRLFGYKGNDQLIGGYGADLLDGSLGNDTLTGGPHADRFNFSSALSAFSNVDHIVGFAHGVDRIALWHPVFNGTNASGSLLASMFFAGAAAHDPSDRIIYNPATGWLTYDGNGNAAGGATHFATLAAHLAPTSSDFFIFG